MGLQLLLTLLSLAGGVISLVSGVVFHKKLFVQMAGILLMLVGFVVMIGYVTHSPIIYTYPPNTTAMALPTGICFSIIGCCLFILGQEMKGKILK